ncbi:MAG TPA: enoyl-CoA hydratase/isomerase family protein [Actinomycetota bacterium]
MTPVRLEQRDRIARLTLDRPEAMNALDEEVLAALPEAIASVADSDARALVITGAGDAFCVGLDIELLGKAFADPVYFRDVLERLKRILLDLEALPVPVIAAVNGLARAGGFELILASDLAIVASEARIGDTHLAFGIVPGGGAVARAPRRLGPQRARELLLTGRWISGDEAASYGLALRAVPRAALDDEVEQLCALLRPLSRSALAATKAAMNEAADKPLREALDIETDQFIRYLTTEPTAREGYQAFVEKREPRWD